MPAEPLSLIPRQLLSLSSRCVARRIVLALLALALPLLSVAAQADVGDALKEIQKSGHARVVLRMRSGQLEWTKEASVARQATAVEAAVSEAEPALGAAHVRNYRRFHTLP
ncbi:MAG: hypothetical protein ACXWJM_17250, partial [Ramlibacter sp.]